MCYQKMENIEKLKASLAVLVVQRKRLVLILANSKCCLRLDDNHDKFSLLMEKKSLCLKII